MDKTKKRLLGLAGGTTLYLVNFGYHIYQAARIESNLRITRNYLSDAKDTYETFSELIRMREAKDTPRIQLETIDDDEPIEMSIEIRVDESHDREVERFILEYEFVSRTTEYFEKEKRLELRRALIPLY